MNKRIPVIFDVDTGLDDTLALFFSVNDLRFNVLAVTTTFGNTTLENATRNTLNALAALGRTDIPVAAGAEKGWSLPLRTSPHIHGKNGVGEYEYEKNSTEAFVNECAWDYTYKVLMQAEEKVVYFALGPCTNIATTLRKYPEIKDKLDKIIFMGGGLREGSAGQCASVNVYHDPHACRFVVNSGVPFHMCTASHMTRFVTISQREMEENFTRKDGVCDVSLAMLRYYYSACGAQGENADERLVLHDPATVLYALEPECFTAKKCYCDLELRGKYTLGFTLIDFHDLMHKPESEKNIHFIMTRPECAQYLSGKFIDGIKNAVNIT